MILERRAASGETASRDLVHFRPRVDDVRKKKRTTARGLFVPQRKLYCIERISIDDFSVPRGLRFSFEKWKALSEFSYMVMRTRVEVWESGKSFGNTSQRRVTAHVFTAISSFPKLSRCNNFMKISRERKTILF